MEEWKHIIGLPLGYEISSQGNVRLNYGTFIEPIHPQIYGGLYTFNACGKQIKVHRSVAETFIENPENKRWVSHKDGNRLNNCVENLEWITQKEKLNRSYKSGSNKNATAIYCIEDDLLFSTITSAEVYYSIPKYAIQESAHSGDACFGYHFRYSDTEDMNPDSFICLSKSDYIFMSKSLNNLAELKNHLVN